MLITLLFYQSTDLKVLWSVFNSMNLPYYHFTCTTDEDIAYTNYITITLNYVNRKWEKKLRTVLGHIGIFACKFVLL